MHKIPALSLGKAAPPQAAWVEDFRTLAPQQGALDQRASLQVRASDQKIGGLLEAALPKLHGLEA